MYEQGAALNFDVAFPESFSLPLLDIFDIRARLVCSFALAVMLSILSRPWALCAAAIVPVALLLFCKGFIFFRPLVRLNITGVFISLLLILTMPDKSEGLRLGGLVLVRLNLISIILFQGVLAMGITRVYSALTLLKCPEKLRLLLIFTLHGVYVLFDRERSLLTALHLRAPHLHGLLKWRAFAAVLGAVLLQGALHSERTMMAVRCRGGFSGFNQTPPVLWRRRDTVLLLATAIFAVMIFMLEYYTNA